MLPVIKFTRSFRIWNSVKSKIRELNDFLLTSSILESMIEDLHPVCAALCTIRVPLTLNLLLLTAVYESRNFSPLHLVSGQELVALVFKVNIILATVCVVWSIVIQLGMIKHLRLPLLRVGVWLSLRIITVDHGDHTAVIILMSAAMLGPLRQVACIG